MLEELYVLLYRLVFAFGTELLDCLGWIDDLEGVLDELPPGSREIVEGYREWKVDVAAGTVVGVVSETGGKRLGIGISET